MIHIKSGKCWILWTTKKQKDIAYNLKQYIWKIGKSETYYWYGSHRPILRMLKI